MDAWLSGVTIWMYFIVLAILAVYGAHRVVLVVGLWRTRNRARSLPDAPLRWPHVIVQLPLFNELYVAQRLIEMVCAIDYPIDQLEIQVLDDSTDETSDIVAALVEQKRRQGFAITHICRHERTGFKAGALDAGMQLTAAEFVAIFDADFVPAPDFLRQTIPYFGDAEVGMVQARWGHINRDYSLLTRLQAVLLDGHFVVDQTVRNRQGKFFNFNGTAGIWRRQAIEDAGGWAHDTITEDLDLSYRAQLAGWQFVYLPDIVAPAELPADVNAYKTQQNRWTKGSVQTARKLLGTVLRAPVSIKIKIEALFHLTANLTYPLVCLLSLLVFPAMYARRDAEGLGFFLLDVASFAAASIPLVLFYGASQRAGGRGWIRRLWLVPMAMALAIGLAVNNTRAVIAGVFRDGGSFDRTPKSGLEGRSGGSVGVRYRRKLDWLFVFEVLFALYALAGFVLAVILGMWSSLPFLYLFVHGHVHMAALGFASLLGRSGRRERSTERAEHAPPTVVAPIQIGEKAALDARELIVVAGRDEPLLVLPDVTAEVGPELDVRVR